MPRFSKGVGIAVLGLIVASSAILQPVYAQKNSQRQEERAERSAQLTQRRLDRCKKREARINSLILRITARGERKLEVFTKISDRTQAFYVRKGNALSNYDALVADVNAKKTAAQTALAEAKAASVTFKCDGTDPVGTGHQIKTALKTKTRVLRAYKTSVRNLIVGVKSVNGKTKSLNNSNRGGNQ